MTANQANLTRSGAPGNRGPGRLTARERPAIRFPKNGCTPGKVILIVSPSHTEPRVTFSKVVAQAVGAKIASKARRLNF
ncbi:MAG: hypothetical protein IIA14_10305 [SAR324 cluster bacterium]|nr:hypothetical protein [SAR324 cluster bacterium]